VNPTDARTPLGGGGERGFFTSLLGGLNNSCATRAGRPGTALALRRDSARRVAVVREMLKTRKRRSCGAALLLSLLLPVAAEAQRGRAAQTVNIRVRANETVSLLAERYGVSAEEIARLNNIEAGARLRPGSVIRVPSLSPPPPLPRRTSLAGGAGADTLARARLHEPQIRAAALRHGVDPRVLWSIAYLESRFQTGLVSPKGARGMMQFMPGTAARYGLQNPNDAAAAVDAAARYVRDLSRRFDNRFELVLAGYNAGEGAVEAYLYGTQLRLPDGRVINPNRIRTNGVPPYAETRNYVARGLEIARALTAANLFAPAGETAGNAPLSLPTEQGGGARRETAPPTENRSAQSAPLFVTPSSSYALTRPENVGTRDAQSASARPSPESNTTAPDTASRSFRASAAPRVAGSSLREGANSANTRASAEAPTVLSSQPRSTYTGVQTRQRR
jgi:soluble lytic murein transglycosylase-like protein